MYRCDGDGAGGEYRGGRTDGAGAAVDVDRDCSGRAAVTQGRRDRCSLRRGVVGLVRIDLLHVTLAAYHLSMSISGDCRPPFALDVIDSVPLVVFITPFIVAPPVVTVHHRDENLKSRFAELITRLLY